MQSHSLEKCRAQPPCLTDLHPGIGDNYDNYNNNDGGPVMLHSFGLCTIIKMEKCLISGLVYTDRNMFYTYNFCPLYYL